MEQDWQDAVDFVLEMEGDYTNDPNDPGGETRWGISRKAYPSLDIKNLSREGAKEIYHRDYWVPCHCNDLPRAFAISLFDCAVNQGPRIAVRIMQIALGVTVDGTIGPKTIAACSAASPRTVLLFLAERMAAYARLMNEKPTLLVFARNWSFRVLSLARRI